MLIALPIYRVCQIRSVSPGFDVPAFEAEATPEALATGDLYRKASKLFVFPKQESEQEKLGLGRPFNEQQREFLKKNADALALELEACGRRSCAFSDADTFSLDLLLKLSGHELEADGKLDEALERYLSAAHVVIQFAQAGANGCRRSNTCSRKLPSGRRSKAKRRSEFARRLQSSKKSMSTI